MCEIRTQALMNPTFLPFSLLSLAVQFKSRTMLAGCSHNPDRKGKLKLSL